LTHDTHMGSHLLLVKTEGQIHEHFFAKLNDPHHEVWDGKLPTEEGLQKQTGIKDIRDVKDFDGVMNRLFQGGSLNLAEGSWFDVPPYLPLYDKLLAGDVELWLPLGNYRRFTGDAALTAAQTFANKIRQHFPEVKIRNITPHIRRMRQIKSESELAKMREAIRITDMAQIAAMKTVQTVEYEYEVEAAIENTFRSAGACCDAFQSIVASGTNGTILHYMSNNEKLGDHDLIITDIGAEVDYYSADVARTFPVSGTFTDDQKTIYNLVLKAQREAISEARIGSNLTELTVGIAEKILGNGLLDLGLIVENTPEQVRSYFLHPIGHGLGLDVHDGLMRYEPFVANMVITVEPGIYVRKQDVVEKDWFKALSAEQQASVTEALDRFNGIGVRIEDDVLITDGDAVILSTGSPVTVQEIEATMARLRQ
ncbi:aminopeptidase P N-terminal domain-containing protein, partial [Paremcibacter congregatus]|uniref:aminopeptidase P N-terminal domain-containing protein n=1 Tax=Paremcibacter congregatus TaxID=2043170 RepID=UPI003A8D9BF2